MPLRLHYHPLSSFCMKVLVPLYEAGADFEKVLVNLGDVEARKRFGELWPGLKFPVLEDALRGAVVAESTTIIEYLDAFHPGSFPLVPKGADAAWRTRMWDRVIDHQIHHSMQKIATDGIRAGGPDPAGVSLARDAVRRGYAMLETQIGASPGPWFWGEAFTLTDCAAAPALWYANTVEPIGAGTPGVRAYLGRLMARPSFARALEEAEPWFAYFPYPAKLSRTLG